VEAVESRLLALLALCSELQSAGTLFWIAILWKPSGMNGVGLYWSNAIVAEGAAGGGSVVLVWSVEISAVGWAQLVRFLVVEST
jgi:hypothetical protein